MRLPQWAQALGAHGPQSPRGSPGATSASIECARPKGKTLSYYLDNIDVHSGGAELHRSMG
jgi:hypothetical protein